MAKAKAQTETRTRTETYQETTGYALLLTPAEASVLAQVLGSVGGYNNGSRGHASRVRTALLDAGVQSTKAKLEGTLLFADGSSLLFNTNAVNW